MADWDLFNGDADGMLALHQLRLDAPRPQARLLTGVKRDIALTRRLPPPDDGPRAGSRVTVLDVSMRANAAGLGALLAAGARVSWFDHHQPGDIPDHPALDAHIDTDPGTCTALIVDRLLGGRHRAWAVAAAFGDNLGPSARAAAAPLQLGDAALDRLRSLGEALNYNSYGETLADLHYPPEALYRRLSIHADPFTFLAEDDACAVLEQACREDMDRARRLTPLRTGAGACLWLMPDAAWSRRVSGPFANLLARHHPHRAHAVAVPVGGGLNVSVRAPLNAPRGAGDFCQGFGGGGREAAGGVNALPQADLDHLGAALAGRWPKASPG